MLNAPATILSWTIDILSKLQPAVDALRYSVLEHVRAHETDALCTNCDPGCTPPVLKSVGKAGKPNHKARRDVHVRQLNKSLGHLVSSGSDRLTVYPLGPLSSWPLQNGVHFSNHFFSCCTKLERFQWLHGAHCLVRLTR